MKYRAILAFIIAIQFQINAERTPENVVITNATDKYEFVAAPGGKTKVKNRMTTEYIATTHNTSIQPFAFYNTYITLDKASGQGKAKYGDVRRNAIFHDDSKICYFDVNCELDEKEKVEFRRTFTDAIFCNRVPICDEYPIKRKTIIFSIPESLSSITLIERNMPDSGVDRKESTAGGKRRIEYTFTDLPALNRDEDFLPSIHSYPQILVTGTFANLDSLYQWYHGHENVDREIPGIKNLLSEIAQGCDSKRELLERTFRWVQGNIRYIAFEDKDAAWRPDTPAEVIRKRYGDCKGMALLTATLLNAQGIEAHTASVGTTDIPYNPSEIPTLASINHEICVAYLDGNPVFLDATCNYIPAGFIPGSIQGKECIADRGDTFECITIPKLPPSASTDRMTYSYTLTDEGLSGNATRTLTGDMKEWLLTDLNNRKKEYHDEFLMKAVIPTTGCAVDRNATLETCTDGTDAIIRGTVLNPSGVTHAEESIFIDLNTDAEPFVTKIDTKKRENALSLPARCLISRESTLSIPEGFHVDEIPSNWSMTTPHLKLSAEFRRESGSVKLTKSIEIEDTDIPLSRIEEFNRAISELNRACSEQIELKK